MHANINIGFDCTGGNVWLWGLRFWTCDSKYDDWGFCNTFSLRNWVGPCLLQG